MVTGVLHLRATSPKSSPFPSRSGRDKSIWDLLHGNKRVLGVFCLFHFDFKINVYLIVIDPQKSPAGIPSSFGKLSSLR